MRTEVYYENTNNIEINITHDTKSDTPEVLVEIEDKSVKNYMRIFVPKDKIEVMFESILKSMKVKGK